MEHIFFEVQLCIEISIVNIFCEFSFFLPDCYKAPRDKSVWGSFPGKTHRDAVDQARSAHRNASRQHRGSHHWTIAPSYPTPSEPLQINMFGGI